MAAPGEDPSLHALWKPLNRASQFLLDTPIYSCEIDSSLTGVSDATVPVIGPKLTTGNPSVGRKGAIGPRRCLENSCARGGANRPLFCLSKTYVLDETVGDEVE